MNNYNLTHYILLVNTKIQKIELFFIKLLNFCSSCVTIQTKRGDTVEKYSTSYRLKQIMSERNLKQIDILNMAKPFAKHTVLN